jgi:DNA-binding transcriptional regulator YdaS (Cro superfamily)
MDLKTFLKSLPDRPTREAFAARVESTLGHLNNVALGYKPCAPILATAIELDTERKVRRWELRPTDWHLIWPELIGAAGAPNVLTESPGAEAGEPVAKAA